MQAISQDWVVRPLDSASDQVVASTIFVALHLASTGQLGKTISPANRHVCVWRSVVKLASAHCGHTQ